MKYLNESVFKYPLLRISAKNRQRNSSNSLSSYSTMSSFRPLPYAQYFQTFIHVFLVLTVFLLTAFSASFCKSSPEITRNSAAIFLFYYFFYNKTKNAMVPSVVMVTLLYHPFFAVIPLLRGNSDTILTAEDEIVQVNITGLIVVA